MKIRVILYHLRFTILVILIVIFLKLVDKSNDKVKLKVLPETNEENISVRNDGIKTIDIYRFWSSS